MNELSLFTGAGGGLLGTKLLGWNHIGYVENNEYCQKVLAQRIKDGFLDEAPIFGDIRAFIGEGYAEAYQGMVDVITAGFPCQPFSSAGRRKSADDDRNMWPETIRCIREISPRFAFLENVPGLISCGYLGTILGDLAESGYDCRWRVLSAAEVGAPHKRDRLWIVAHDQSIRFVQSKTIIVDDSKNNSQKTYWSYRKRAVSGSILGRDYPHPADKVLRVEDDDAYYVDRIKAIGNGQVPAVVKTVWRLLTDSYSTLDQDEGGDAK